MSPGGKPDHQSRKLDREAPNEVGSSRLYQYDNLEGNDDIRLIVLFPSPPGRPVQIELLICDLKDAPDYEALSYTWADFDGDQSRDGNIWCEPGGQRILVTRNCEDALRHLRLRHEPRFLWVDAISINQTDTPEKNRQVSMMPRIYHSASRVVVYLGGATTETDEFLDFLRNGPLDIEKAFDRFIPVGKLILSRRWFKRLWVLQEVALARAVNIMCGDNIISWQKFAKYYEEVFSRTDHVRRFQHLNVVFEHALKGIRPMKHLPKLFTDSWSHSSSDPRDRVFALLGMVAKDRPLTVVTEYGVPNARVFKELAIHFIKEFNLLFANRRSTQPSDGWSSWVFDWSQPRVHPFFPLKIGHEVSVDDLGGGLGLLKIVGRQVLDGIVCHSYWPRDHGQVGWGEISVDGGLTFAAKMTKVKPSQPRGKEENDLQEELLQGVIVVEVSPGFCVLLSRMGDHCAFIGGIADFHRCEELSPGTGLDGRKKLHTEPDQCKGSCSRPYLQLGDKESFIIL